MIITECNSNEGKECYRLQGKNYDFYMYKHHGSWALRQVHHSDTPLEDILSLLKDIEEETLEERQYIM